MKTKWMLPLGVMLTTSLLLHNQVSAQTLHEEHYEEEHHEEQSVNLTAAEIDEFGIRLATAEAGVIEEPIELSGEIVVNPDRFAHVVPRVDGIVKSVLTGIGDRVSAGGIMATIDSRELSDLKSAYLAAQERSDLASVSFEREQRLWRQEISSERDYLQAKQAYVEGEIAARSTRYKLLAIGFTARQLQALQNKEDELFSRFEIRAPFDGVVVAKHITLGESVDGDTEVYSVTDLSQVWAVLTVYPRELRSISEGLVVTIRDRQSGINGTAQGTISYVSPVIDKQTRTASVRVVIENSSGTWRPGMFVHGSVAVSGTLVPVMVPATALQTIDDKNVVFVYDGTQFHLHEVETGRSTSAVVEIVAGIEAGARVASEGAFTLKAQIQKGEFESGHNH